MGSYTSIGTGSSWAAVATRGAALPLVPSTWSQRLVLRIDTVVLPVVCGRTTKETVLAKGTFFRLLCYLFCQTGAGCHNLTTTCNFWTTTGIVCWQNTGTGCQAAKDRFFRRGAIFCLTHVPAVKTLPQNETLHCRWYHLGVGVTLVLAVGAGKKEHIE